jgi:hypothetical protein
VYIDLSSHLPPAHLPPLHISLPTFRSASVSFTPQRSLVQLRKVYQATSCSMHLQLTTMGHPCRPPVRLRCEHLEPHDGRREPSMPYLRRASVQSGVVRDGQHMLDGASIGLAGGVAVNVAQGTVLNRTSQQSGVHVRYQKVYSAWTYRRRSLLLGGHACIHLRSNWESVSNVSRGFPFQLTADRPLMGAKTDHIYFAIRDAVASVTARP